MKNDRDRTLDFYKGVIILGIVMTHTLFVYTLNDSEPFDIPDPGLKEIVYGIGNSGMIMLFAISGYYYRPNRSFRENTVKRMKRLLIPFVVLVAALPSIVFIILCLRGENPDAEMLFQIIGSTYLGQFFCVDNLGLNPLIENQFFACVHPLYYLEILIVGSVVFYLVAKWCIGNWKRCSATIAALLLVSGIFYGLKIRLPFCLEYVPIAVSFMLVGAFAKKYEFVKLVDEGWKTAKNWILALSMLILCATMLYISPMGDYYHFLLGKIGVLSAYTYFVGQLSGGIFLLMLYSLLVKIPYVNTFFEYFGRNSLWIFVFHMFYVKLISSFFFEVSTTVAPEIDYGSPQAAIAIGIAAIVLSALTAILYRTIKDTMKERKNAVPTYQNTRFDKNLKEV